MSDPTQPWHEMFRIMADNNLTMTVRRDKVMDSPVFLVTVESMDPKQHFGARALITEDVALISGQTQRYISRMLRSLERKLKEST